MVSGRIRKVVSVFFADKKYIMSTYCGWCGEQQFSVLDQKYLVRFGVCWREDQEKWKEGRMTKEKFEQREQQALEDTSK
jgi:hypothetical protein